MVFPLMSGPLNGFQIDPFFGHFIQRGHFPQLRHYLDNLLNSIVNLVVRVEPTKAEANRGMSQFSPDAEGAKHIGRLQRS